MNYPEFSFPETSRDHFLDQAKQNLENLGFKVEDFNPDKRWGGYIRIESPQLPKFLDRYYQGVRRLLKIEPENCAPKILIVWDWLSWQYHDQRSEYWRNLMGYALIAQSPTDHKPENLEILRPGSLRHIPQGSRHSVRGYRSKVILAEIWQGAKTSEADIIRIEDPFRPK